MHGKILRPTPHNRPACRQRVLRPRLIGSCVCIGMLQYNSCKPAAHGLPSMLRHPAPDQTAAANLPHPATASRQNKKGEPTLPFFIPDLPGQTIPPEPSRAPGTHWPDGAIGNSEASRPWARCSCLFSIIPGHHHHPNQSHLPHKEFQRRRHSSRAVPHHNRH